MKREALALLTLAGLAGCGGGAGMAPPPATTTPPAAMSIDFTAFTKALVADQSETATPVAVTPAQFVFRDDDNPQAFASVLPGP